MKYEDFIHSKMTADRESGHVVDDVNDMLFPFQSAIVKWAVRKGKAAIFADCGMGKTAMQLEWARHVPGRVLLIAPLAVSHQTIREGQKFGIDAEYATHQDASDCKIVVTNYERLDNFTADGWHGVVLDESSIIKSFTGKIRDDIIGRFLSVPYRLACTATPAPNDFMELGNHAEFCGSMTRTEMLSMFFVHDGGETQKWRLKGHAQSDFWKWICSWAVMVRKPSDIGFDDVGFTLPPIHYHHHTVDALNGSSDMLFAMPAITLQERIVARRDTVTERAQKMADIVNATPGSWVIWCNRNDESETITRMICGSCVEVTGSMKSEDKAALLHDFSADGFRVLVTKPKIAGFGMNWQHCANVGFLGMNDSWESYYQAVRRCWRFGQNNHVNVHIVTADIEGAVVENIKRKEKDAEKMAKEMVNHMSDITKAELSGTSRKRDAYLTQTDSGDMWRMVNGDCVEGVREIESDSIGYTIFSPPFASLYTYSASERDMGNCKDDDEFFAHFDYLIGELMRVTMPGRLVSFHCMNLPTSKARDGVIGIRDFRGHLIAAFERHGWIFHSEVCIWKDPVTAMQRTKALGLLHKQIVKDSAMSRQGIPDYLVTMRKPGDNRVPCSGEFTEFVGTDFHASGKNKSIDIWQRYASPVWMDINPSRTLQKGSAREEKDERHICPLQLDVIERGLQLWSMPGDIVLSPFAGIGSEGHCAVRMDRRFIGIELKESYYRQAVANLRNCGDQMELNL